MADHDPQRLIQKAIVDTNIALWIWRKLGNEKIVKELEWRRESLRDTLKSVQDTQRREAKPL